MRNGDLRSEMDRQEGNTDERSTLDRVRASVKKLIEASTSWFTKLKQSNKAVRELIADPDDTKKVFEVMATMRGNSLIRIFKRFKATKTGEKILRQQIELLDTLNDHAYLNSLKPDSFGQAYLSFLDKAKLESGGLVYASEEYYQNVNDPELLRFMRRNRDSHDLWHTLTQYGRDTLGETCLLAFTYAQTKNPGIRMILLLASFRLYREYGHGTFAALWRAYGDGKRASWLLAQPYEDMLQLNIEQVRVMLTIPDPNAYRVVLARQNTPKKRLAT
ncbi:MAG: ubiquinone biosynthesis protein [Gammaproteobacteria bacterium]|nr:ubiquinone biosynthesis protein [Gammaproteobacteria bacterium]MYF38696.1 ubiquinone biosynthesis protein [Gammaproteobacteria bacterium]